MSRVTPVKDHAGWYRDSNGAIQCSNTYEYDKYIKNYRANLDKEKQMETLQTEVSELKSDMSEIKSLLLTLVQSQN
tara:strand:- start:587 stop:814 length:228 start_codon:yes stop_codon:yes gene_type:complete